MESIGVKFPFKETELGGIIGVIDTYEESIQSNLIAFLTLRKGQRVMHNKLYSPLYDFVMESWDEITEDSLLEAITESLEQFFPEILVKEIIFDFNEETHVLNIKIKYEIIKLKTASEIEIALPIEN